MNMGMTNGKPQPKAPISGPNTRTPVRRGNGG